jgi:hypothetical protein
MIVVATGDGVQTAQGCSFTDQIRRAAKRGWKAEIWSWRVQLSPRLRDTRIKYATLVTVFMLDEWYRSIVFLKGGSYHLKGNSVMVQTRSCDELNLTEATFREAAALGAALASPTGT